MTDRRYSWSSSRSFCFVLFISIHCWITCTLPFPSSLRYPSLLSLPPYSLPPSHSLLPSQWPNLTPCLFSVPKTSMRLLGPYYLLIYYIYRYFPICLENNISLYQKRRKSSRSSPMVSGVDKEETSEENGMF